MVSVVYGSGEFPQADGVNVPVELPGTGRPEGHHLESTPSTVRWGWVSGGGTTPVLRIQPGDIVTIDTVSHEGILPDQGRDPISYFGNYGVSRSDVLDDVIAIAASDLPCNLKHDGPHVVTGPIWIEGAEPGDLLEVQAIDLHLRAGYGIVSNRHGKGALAGELPEADPIGGTTPEVISRFATVETGPLGWMARIHGTEVSLMLPLRPFLGLVAVAPASGDAHSVPPGPHGGNLDVRLLGRGSRLYLPVNVPGALLQVGDPHFAQGDGEVALTALEGPLRAVLRIELHKGAAPSWGLPYGETEDAWLILGLHEDLDEAVRIATRAALTFVEQRTGTDRATAYAWLSAAADLTISQVVDRIKGVHFIIPKLWLDQYIRQ
jgi:acetamidase/formamidase